MKINKIEDIYLVKNDKEVYVKAQAENVKSFYRQSLTSADTSEPTFVEAFISALELEAHFDEDLEPEDLVEYSSQYLKNINYDLDWRVIEDDY
jgi:hypothetical protein